MRRNHFEDSQFMNKSKKALIRSAIPTKFDIPNPPKLIVVKRKNPMDHVRKRSSESSSAGHDGEDIN